MTLSKSETNTAILNEAKESDKHLDSLDVEVRKRHLNSVHPLDCECLIHLEQRKLDVPTAQSEKEARVKLDYYQGD